MEKRNAQWVQLFGLLDFIGFIWMFNAFTGTFVGLAGIGNWVITTMEVAYILLIASLPVSGVFHVIKHRWAPTIYFSQLPFRVLFLVFTLGFLSYIGMFLDSRTIYLSFMGLAALAEVFRFSLSVRVMKARKQQSKSK